MKEWLIEHKLYVAAAVLLTIGGFYYFNDSSASPEQSLQAAAQENKLEAVSEKPDQEKQDIKQPETIMVDVKGQVKRPGVYQASAGERVIDVIGRAGGLTAKADQTQVNFAEHVQDEMVIYIPSKGEDGLAVPGIAAGGQITNGGASNQQGKINLNKADTAELQTIPGIGPAKAAAIIDYRETSGGFKTIEDLKNISGIGDKTFEKLKDLVDVR
ncbi:helix-hairpin-helix domain-containing protein [Neobacillus mesonae]|uniref:helix-hairpin-helix domain-containing protein n=1 Tax=Neobacillus mesonae TaxID=1193713 RepID=UPI00082F385B|nr:helix-hairpin-helix domain-containing protein [Neobacillus mesonae]MED4204481.1 helix-hairpin-helix domain-containing protein [Neobacillus mesonae]